MRIADLNSFYFGREIPASLTLPLKLSTTLTLMPEQMITQY